MLAVLAVLAVLPAGVAWRRPPRMCPPWDTPWDMPSSMARRRAATPPAPALVVSLVARGLAAAHA